MDKDAPAGCLHIFPAVISLARNTAGFTRWSRLAIDKNEETKAIAKEFGVSSVPSFVFIADGKVVDRYSGSDRVELMNHVLRFQEANGVRLPQRAAANRQALWAGLFGGRRSAGWAQGRGRCRARESLGAGHRLLWRP